MRLDAIVADRLQRSIAINNHARAVYDLLDQFSSLSMLIVHTDN